MSHEDLLNRRGRVAREAANLLYLGIEKEYKKAKLKAAKNLSTHDIPSNLEVAFELDRIAEENEGQKRAKRLIQMRRQALELMTILKEYEPILIGSVWRGTIHNRSDIDIAVYHEDSVEVLKAIKQRNIGILLAEHTSVTKNGQMKSSFHIHLSLPRQEKAEIIVRDPTEAGKIEECEIYGDPATGLGISKLKMILQRYPTQRFVPF